MGGRSGRERGEGGKGGGKGGEEKEMVITRQDMDINRLLND